MQSHDWLAAPKLRGRTANLENYSNITNIPSLRYFADASWIYNYPDSGMDAEGPARALEQLSPAESILQQKSGALQGLAQPGGNDGGILSQLLSNPFFTAVSSDQNLY